jgi:hypothetical protein
MVVIRNKLLSLCLQQIDHLCQENMIEGVEKQKIVKKARVIKFRLINLIWKNTVYQSIINVINQNQNIKN